VKNGDRCMVGYYCLPTSCQPGLLTSDFALAALNFDCTAVALKRHERVNAFNLVLFLSYLTLISVVPTALG